MLYASSRWSASRELLEPWKLRGRRLDGVGLNWTGERSGEEGSPRVLLLRTGEVLGGNSSGVEGAGEVGRGLHCMWGVVGLSHGLPQELTMAEVSTERDFCTGSFLVLFFLSLLGLGVVGVSIEEERGRRLLLLPLASRFTVHQLLFPVFSLGTFTNRSCSDRLWRMEFCEEGGVCQQEGRGTRATQNTH